MRERSSTTQRWLLDAWVLALTALLTWPMWTARGFGLARDLIFTPERPLTPDTVGLGSSLPRAVPLDAVLSLGTSVIGGEALFRVCVAGVLLAAGCGAHRFLAGAPTAARFAAATLAVWNPFVIERLAMGQWALLTAYAALFWLATGVPRVLAMGLASVTPTGGTIIVLFALARAAVARQRRAYGCAGLAMAFQLPWLLPSLLGQHQLTSDPRGADAFAPSGGPAGAVVSLLGGGGIWNPFATPDSQGTWYAVAAALLVAVSVLLTGAELWRRAPALVVTAAVGLVIAVLAAVPAGSSLLGWLAAEVPGGGLLRDGQKWVLPYAALGALAFGLLVERAWNAVRRLDLAPVVGVLLVCLPVVAVPDAPASTWEVLRPVRYPAEFRQVVKTLDEAGDDSGAVVTLPWASYRRFDWGLDLSAADPLPRWTRRPVVVSDALATSEGDLRGEDARAAEVGRILRGEPAGIAEALAAAGVGWVVRYHGTEPAETVPALPGLSTVVSGETITLERVDARVDVADRASGWRAFVVVGVDLLLGLVLAVAAASAIARRVRHRSTRPAPEPC